VSERALTAARGLSRLSDGLRTPLALISGYAELLTIRQDEETLAQAPHRIKDAATELTRIVEDLLTVYAIDANVLYLAPVQLSVTGLVEEAVAEAGRRGTNVVVETDEASQSAQVLADPEYAGSMISSLLENARNRSANSGATLSVRSIGGFVQVEVADPGGRVEESDRTEAFEPFSSLQPRTGLTTGLELYKVRRLAELQRGQVWIDDGPGDQARFGFALPLARAQ
jgi:signal transduction histidine kinase